MMESALDNPCYFTHTTFKPAPKDKSTLPAALTNSLKKRKGCSTPSLHPGDRDRRNRSLLRSLSANADDTRLLVLGNPRPSDLAPCESPKRGNGKGDFQGGDMVLCTGAAAPSEPPPPFLEPGPTPRYVNTATLPPPGRRRHSLTSFLRPVSAAALRVPDGHLYPRSTPAPVSETGMKCSDILDILLVYYGQSEGSTQWANYLTHCFQQIAREQARSPFRIANVHIEDVLTGAMSWSEQEKLSHARLQIVIVCPHFLSRLDNCTPSSPGLSSLLQSGKVLAMLLGVNEEYFTNQQRRAMMFNEQWRRLVVKDQDPAFVGDFLGVAMDIFSRSWHLQMAISQASGLDDKAHFSVLPKKIKMGQNKVIISLTEPLEADDNIRITLEKSGEKIEVSAFKKKNPYTIQFAVPPTCLQVSLLINVFLEKNGKPLGHRAIKCESRMRELEQILRSCDKPLFFMCQTLGLGPGEKDQLDSFLVSAFQRNIPPDFSLLAPAENRFYSSPEEYPTLLHFAAKFGLEKLCWQLLECPGGVQACQIRNGSQLTPADMAEQSGHLSLTNALKGYLQMTELTSMYHYLKGMSDGQLAFNDSNYLIPRPMLDTYSIPPHARPFNAPISPPSTRTTPTPVATPLSTPASPFYTNITSYAVPPSPVSVSFSPGANYQFPPPPLPVSFGNYQMPVTEGSISSPVAASTPTDGVPPFGGYMHMSASNREGSANHLRGDLKLDLESKSGNKRDTLGSISSGSAENSSGPALGEIRPFPHHSNPQDELAEILMDFKNHAHTIAEVENLVESWRNRNDVQQSFREKQEQIHQMRLEYERIQNSMKEKLKRPTPFERIKKLFTRKSKHTQEHSLSENGKYQPNPDAVCNRLASSLSLHSSSSSSSGRVSSTSGVSVSESYAHSEYNERRNTGSSDSKSTKPGSASSKEDISTMGSIRYNFPNTFKIHSEYVLSNQAKMQENTDDKASESNESSNRGSWTSQEQFPRVLEEDSFSEHSENQSITVAEIHNSDTNDDSPLPEKRPMDIQEKSDDLSETEDSPLLCKVDANKNILVKYSVTKV
ncbi:uncharacterized protein stumps [Bemisia tabaci]